MNRLTPAELPAFLRRYRFPGGRVRAVRLVNRTEQEIAVELRLVVREAIRDLGSTPRRVKLVLRLEGVDYDAATPALLSPEEADPQVRAAFGRLERASMRMVGIRQFLRLSLVPTRI